VVAIDVVSQAVNDHGIDSGVAADLSAHSLTRALFMDPDHVLYELSIGPVTNVLPFAYKTMCVCIPTSTPSPLTPTQNLPPFIANIPGVFSFEF
jgi:hypothetical protein